MSEELIKQPSFPSITIEIHGGNLVPRFNLPKDINSQLFALFLHKLSRGEYQQIILGALMNAGHQAGMVPVVTQIVEQVNFMSKSMRPAIHPLDVLRNKGE